QFMAAMIWSTESCVERATSVSSMRSTNSPPWWRAYAHEYSAVRAVPRWRKPVGDGAMRVRMGVVTVFVLETRRHPAGCRGRCVESGVSPKAASVAGVLQRQARAGRIVLLGLLRAALLAHRREVLEADVAGDVAAVEAGRLEVADLLVELADHALHRVHVLVD